MEFFQHLFSSDFMPHGFCYLWNPRILWLHVISDALIAFSYYCIPIILVYFIRKNRDLPFNKIFWMFGTFILACGTTHLMEIWNVWHGNYLIAGIIKAVTAAVSLLTAAMLVPLIPELMSLSDRAHLQEVNRKLKQEIAYRKQFDSSIDVPLRHKVTGGFIAAMLLTTVVGFSFWRGAQQAAQDDHLVSRSYEVIETIQRAAKEAIAAQTSARAFSVSGREPLLLHYQAVRDSVFEDERELRLLTADDRTQQRRLDVLEPQVQAAIDFADSIIAKRRKLQAYPADSVLGIEKNLDILSATTQDLYEEETKVLNRCKQRAASEQSLTKVIAIVGVFLGTGLWVLAALAVMREIDTSGRIRAQLGILNAELEGRVDRRTAALQSEVRERKLAQEALLQSDERRRIALETARLGDWGLDLTTLQITRSLLHDEIFGYKSLLPEWTFDIFVSHIHPDDRERVRENFRSCALLKKRWEFECRIASPNGDTRWIWACSDHYRDPSGALTRMFGIVKDITDQKQAEFVLTEQAEELARSRLALEAQTLMLESVLESMAEGLVAADEHGKLIIWNNAAENILGMGSSTISSDEWAEHYGLFLPDAVTRFPIDQTPMHRALRGETCTIEFFLRNVARPNGAWIEASAAPRKDKNGAVQGGVVAFRDVTQKKAAEQEIQKLNDELELRVAERTLQLEIANKELETFSYSVSHDLRAPLRHISGFSKMLVEEFGSTLGPGAQHYLDRIQAGTQKMGLLVDELLNLARVGRYALNRQTTQLNPVISEVIAMLEPDTAGREVQWKIAELPAVECDPILVKQIFQNLLTNALKFTRIRGQTVIEIACPEKGNGEPPVFVVRDNGIGFNMKYVDKLFGVFQRLHRSEDFEGTGIGLATVQRIVQKHSGRVWAEGEVDRGAAFYFTLGVEKQMESKSNGATAGGQS